MAVTPTSHPRRPGAERGQRVAPGFACACPGALALCGAAAPPYVWVAAAANPLPVRLPGLARPCIHGWRWLARP
ncbi:MAG TPA: hypothetical protein VKD72_29140, partial [Gemmataceae bacterium]|nr:hypothetical protein [Gemmataceae bacterium]